MIPRVALRIGVCFSLVGSAITLGVCDNAEGGPAGSAALKISLVAQPTQLAVTGHEVGEPNDQYAILLTNIGGVPSSGQITLTDTLPEGVTIANGIEGSGWACPVAKGANVVTCVYNGEVPALGQSSTLTLPVAVATKGTVTNKVTVSGGDALTTSVSLLTKIGSNKAPFAFLDFSSQASDIFGMPYIQAGGHPYALTTILDFPQWEGEGSLSPERPVRLPRAMRVDLPAGLIGDPRVVSQCTMVAVLVDSCPSSSRVGTSFIDFGAGIAGGSGPVYNVVPESGYPAEFAVYDEKVARPVFMYASVRTSSDYGVRLFVPNIPPAASLTNVVVTFFGDPQGVDGGGNSSAAFFTNPSDCTHGPFITKAEVDSWEEPENWVMTESQAVSASDCDRLEFQPALSLHPNTPLADEPTGYTTDLEVPQSQATGLEGLATPPVMNATVTFPEGVSLAAGAADGLAGCSADGPEGINLTSAEPGHCPLASQIGTAEAVTPLLEQPLKGHIYVALPGCGGAGNGCTEADVTNGTLFGAYLELEGSGVVIKQHLNLSVNPLTGQLTTSVKNAPQQPFSDLKITLKDGPRAPLSNPQTCGQARTSSDITPWSSPQTPDAIPVSEFAVTGCNGFPFAPSFEAGSTYPTAGAYTNITATISRSDRQQDISAVQAQAPSGLLAMLSHVTLCGEEQANAGTCSSASEVGTVAASAGAGSHPYWVTGKVYLTGPYNGAPFGVSIVVPAKAGPFNLGTVISRARIDIDPTTAAATITSNALPQIIDGVPLRVQTINFALNRQQFAFNPTNCEAKQLTATISAAQGAVAHVSSPFAVGGCKNLPFDPGFTVATRSPGSKKKGTSFAVKISSEQGQANIHSVAVKLPKQLPSRLTTIQQACPEATFAANPATCPAGSLVGYVKGTTPVLPVPVVGPVYLVSHGGAAFPDIEMVLQGEGVRVDLVGSIDIAHGVTSSTFAGVPDVPITKFEVNFPEGPHSALTTNGSLCPKRGLVMPVTIVGQNGRRLVRSVKVAVSGKCAAVKPKAKKARK